MSSKSRPCRSRSKGSMKKRSKRMKVIAAVAKMTKRIEMEMNLEISKKMMNQVVKQIVGMKRVEIGTPVAVRKVRIRIHIPK